MLTVVAVVASAECAAVDDGDLVSIVLHRTVGLRSMHAAVHGDCDSCAMTVTTVVPLVAVVVAKMLTI